jgi:isopropylmalate/homocitrate/citramalate synthase
MQTERVTFLTTPDHKAALDAFAAGSGRSVGHIVREATSRFIAEPKQDTEDEEALALALPTVEAAVAEMRETIATMRADIERTCAVVDAVLAGDKA